MDIFHKKIYSPNTLVHKAKRMKYPTNILTDFVPVETIWYKTKGQKLELPTTISSSELHYSTAGAGQLKRIPFP